MFRTITDADWERELKRARAEANEIVEQIRAAVALNEARRQREIHNREPSVSKANAEPAARNTGDFHP